MHLIYIAPRWISLSLWHKFCVVLRDLEDFFIQLWFAFCSPPKGKRASVSSETSDKRRSVQYDDNKPIKPSRFLLHSPASRVGSMALPEEMEADVVRAFLLAFHYSAFSMINKVYVGNLLNSFIQLVNTLSTLSKIWSMQLTLICIIIFESMCQEHY